MLQYWFGDVGLVDTETFGCGCYFHRFDGFDGGGVEGSVEPGDVGVFQPEPLAFAFLLGWQRAVNGGEEELGFGHVDGRSSLCSNSSAANARLP